MSKRETTEAFLSKYSVLDIQGASLYITDDFTYSGPFPEPLSFEDWKQSSIPFQKSFPDWNFNAALAREEEDAIHITVHVTATHTGDFDLSGLGMGVVPATGKAIALPETKGRLTFEGDKIANLDLDMVEGTGIPGILAQLGVSKPEK
jgi:hypothetical protein